MTTAQDFVLQITSIQFDFDGYEWASDFRSEVEWIDYQQRLTSQYQCFSILFEGYQAPDPDEDETVNEYMHLHGSEESFYFRVLQNWVDSEIGWLFKSIDYSVCRQLH